MLYENSASLEANLRLQPKTQTPVFTLFSRYLESFRGTSPSHKTKSTIDPTQINRDQTILLQEKRP